MQPARGSREQSGGLTTRQPYTALEDTPPLSGRKRSTPPQRINKDL